MALSIEQLTDPPTRAECSQWMIDTLREFGFVSTGWQPGRIQQTILNAAATGVEGALQLASVFVANSFNSLATGAGLTLYSASRFSNTRDAATQAAGPMTLSNSGAAVYTITPGQLLVRDPLGVEFTNTTGGTLLGNNTLDLDFQAVLAGQDGSIRNGADLTLVTPLAGVTVDNPGPGDLDGDGYDDPWYTLATGTDEQSDEELRALNSTKWGTLSVEKTATAVEYLARRQTGVAKVRVIDDNPRGDFTVDVIVSALQDPVSAAELDAAQDAFHEYTFGTNNSIATDPTTDPVNGRYLVKNAATQTGAPAVDFSLVLTGNVYYDPQYTEAEMKLRLAESLSDLLDLVPIGGRDYGEHLQRALTRGDVSQAIETTRGVRTSTFAISTDGVDAQSGNLIFPSSELLLTAPADWFTTLTLVAVES